jgi:hypothetical protein
VRLDTVQPRNSGSVKLRPDFADAPAPHRIHGAETSTGGISTSLLQAPELLRLVDEHSDDVEAVAGISKFGPIAEAIARSASAAARMKFEA